MEFHPSLQTVVFISVFLLVYLVVLLKNAIKNTIDLYDLLILSSIAIAPSIFVFFPNIVVRIARLVGVTFPFLLLFGFLFFIVFVYLYRIVVKINNHNNMNKLLVQELSLLRQKLQQQEVNIKDKEEKKHDICT